MTYFKLKLMHFTFYLVYAILLFKLIGVLMMGESLWSFGIGTNLLLPIAMVLVFEFLMGHLREKTYFLQPGQSPLVIRKLYALGYLPTADAGPVFFYKKRKITGWKTARIEEGEKYLILKILEVVPEFENGGSSTPAAK